MITVFMEYYWNDTQCEKIKENFPSLAKLEDWIFSQMWRDCSSGECYVRFPTPKKIEGTKYKGPNAIEFKASMYDPFIFIHKIESRNEIIFSDGRMTGGRKSWSTEVREWLTHCEERRCNIPNLADDTSTLRTTACRDVIYGYQKFVEREPLILETEDWTSVEWTTLCRLCHLPVDRTERIVINASEIECFINEERTQAEPTDVFSSVK